MLRCTRRPAMWHFSRVFLCRPSIEDSYASTGSSSGITTEKHRTSLKFSIERHRSGSLLETLRIFEKNSVNLLHISTRRVSDDVNSRYVTVFVDCSGQKKDDNIQCALNELEKKLLYVSCIGSWSTPWYPTHISHLDLLNQSVLAAGAELMDDPDNPHPGFHDPVYRAQRRSICDHALQYRWGQPLPDVAYSKEDQHTWGVIWDRLIDLYPTHACKEFNYNLPLLVENAQYGRHSIPQIRQVNEYLESRTGFTLRPVAGLLSSRDFLSGLAFRVFHCTQYIRHASKPLYTPEPDVVHELMGHCPMFADPHFADFSQQIGLASLGASDEEIQRLASCYWFTVEFGLVEEKGGVRAYGAGILSSFGELEHAIAHKSKELPFDPFVASHTKYPVTQIQPLYFVARSFREAKKQMIDFTESIDRPFTLEYNPYQKTIVTYPKNCSEGYH